MRTSQREDVMRPSVRAWRAASALFGGMFLVWASGCAGARVEPSDGSPPADLGPTDALDGDATTEDASEDSGLAPDTAPPEDAPLTDTSPPVDGPLCAPNRDGEITRAESPFLVGATVIYAINRDGTTVDGVNTAGAAGADGRLWDFSAAVPADHRVLEEVLPPAGQWWSSSYPNATFAALLESATSTYGVYRATADALELLGTVSREQNRTNLRMDPAVIVLRFPLREGSTWEQTVNGAGVYNFTPLANVTRYTTRVDARGEVRTPAGRFPVLRIRTDLDQSIPLTIIRRTRRTYTFLSECWGVVARVASVDDESAVEFTRASEYRRLSL